MRERILAVYRDPFCMSPQTSFIQTGSSLQDMIPMVRGLPEGWPRHESDVICINGHPVPQALWGMVKPKPAANGIRVEVSFHAPPMGGDDGGKQILSLVASIGLLFITSGVASGALLGGLTGASAAGGATVLSRLLAAGIALAGSAVLSALAPTPSIPGIASPDTDKGPGQSSVNGNVLEPNGSMPRAVGTFKVFPPFASEPLIYYNGQDEVVEATLALAGPHQLADIRVNDAPIDDVPDVEYQTHEGFTGTQNSSIVARYARTVQTGSELSAHKTQDESRNSLDVTEGIADAVPKPKILLSRIGQDEFWVNLAFVQGLSLSGSTTDDIRVPFRIRFREKGTTTWINCPELHYMGAELKELRAMIKFVWTSGPPDTVAVSNTGWVEARIVSPGQAVAPASADYEANSYFDANTGGDEYADGANAGTSDVINVIMNGSEATIYLDDTTFPRGQYEFEITRGYGFRAAQYTASTYVVASNVRNFFGYESGGVIYQTQKGLIDRAFVRRHSSIFNKQPIQKGGVAYIALKAKNTDLQNISVLASGYVRDWDGSGWNTWTTTANPAPHIRDCLMGELNADALYENMVDNQMLLDLRTAATTNAYNCNAVIQDMSVADAVQVLAGAAYAKLYNSEKTGVILDYDRTAESPVQYFSDHNAANFMWSKAFPDLPDGYRITYWDKDNDYTRTQLVWPATAQKTEQITYQGLTEEADVKARAEYDLATLRKRSTFYSWDAAAEAIKCRRGDLVGAQFGMLTDYAASGRISNIEFDGSGDVTAITLDQANIDILNGDAFDAITDMKEVDNVAEIGLSTGILIRRSGGAVTVHEVASTDADGRYVFTTAFSPNGVEVEDLAIVGPYGEEVRRLVVLDMMPRENFVWAITAVAEAPEIWS